MRILVVFAHPKRDSFTGRILDSFVAGLEQAGHVAEVADLYSEGFQPLLVPEDYAQWEDRPMPADVLREQARVERSEGIALVFPVWWWSMPAILKGWFDRVFAQAGPTQKITTRGQPLTRPEVRSPVPGRKLEGPLLEVRLRRDVPPSLRSRDAQPLRRDGI